VNLPTPDSRETSDADSSSEGEGGSLLPNEILGHEAAVRQSESPIDEDVFKELLSGGKARDFPTPESQDG